MGCRTGGALGFAGQVTEPGLDLQYLRARYYDPKTAQFISRDPQEAKTRQPYLYAAGNPTMYTDPSGESIFGDAFGNLFGGLGRGASWGAVKRGNPCSWWTFWGEQLGGIADPLRKIRAVGAVLSKVDEIADLGLASRGVRPAAGTRVRPAGVPAGWRIRGTKTGGGTQYYDPKNPGNSVRVMQGSSKSPHANSQAPYVRWQRNGQPLDARGEPLPSANMSEAHIPLSEFEFRPELFD